MTTVSIGYRKLPTVTNLVVTGGVQTAELTWDASADVSHTYQVWTATTNNVADATLLASVSSNHFTCTGLSTSTSHYFWVRIIDTNGATGNFSAASTDYRVGANFNTLKLEIYDYPGGTSVTTSIDYVSCTVWYTTSAGYATSVGPSSFTTAFTSTTDTSNVWANPDYARTSDGSYATVTTSTGSSNLVCTLADLGVPSDATVTAMQVSVLGKTTKYSASQLYAYVTDGTGQFELAFTKMTANNTVQTVTAGSSSTNWGFGSSGALVTFTGVSATSIANPTYSSVSTSTSVSSSTGTVSAYGTWQSFGYTSWTATSNSVTTLSQIMATTITSATSTTGQTLYCMVRTRLYDVTAGADVPGAVNTQVVYIHADGVGYGSTSNVTSFTNSFASVGGSSAIIVGHTYRVYLEAMRKQVLGTPTATMTVNIAGLSASSSASVS